MIVAQRCAVERVAVEERRVVDEIELHSGANAAVEDRTKTIAVVEGNGDAGDHDPGIVEFGLLVARQEDGDLMSQTGERGRQGSYDIRQPASLRKGYALGCRKGDIHETSRRKRRCASVATPNCVTGLRTMMLEMPKQLSLIGELKEGQCGKDRTEQIRCWH